MTPDEFEKLRKKAKERLEKIGQKANIPVNAMKPEDLQQAYHNLQVYQVELEVQNEELISSQTQLMALSEKYESLYNYAPVGYLTIKMEGLVSEGNQTFADMVGMSKEYLTNKSIRIWLPQEDSLVYYDNRKALIESRQPQTFRVNLISNNKTVIPVQMTLKLDNESHPSQILVIVVDETDVKNLEDSHRNLVEYSAQGMWLFSNKQLVFSNSRSCEIIGCRRKEFIGFGLKDFQPMIEEESWEDFMNFFKPDEEFTIPESPVIIKFTYNKQARWLELYGSRSNYFGNPALQFTFVDVTERIVANERLKTSEAKLRELNATKDRFFSIIAHDLKNPFSALMGFSELLLEEYNDFSDEERMEMIKKIFEASNSTFKLLENLLKWSRIQINSLEYTPSILNLNTCSVQTIELLNQSAIQKNIQLRNDIPKNLKVFTDKGILQTILRNLITNAIKFTRSGGNVLVDAQLLKSGKVEVKIKDDGIGMNEKERSKIFNIENKSGKSGTAGEKGTGLGLILCKEFVKVIGGEIWVNSAEGKGSEFCFTLHSELGGS